MIIYVRNMTGIEALAIAWTMLFVQKSSSWARERKTIPPGKLNPGGNQRIRKLKPDTMG